MLHTFVNRADELITIAVEGEQSPVVTTPGHPFYVRRARDCAPDEGESRRWLLAGQMKAGDMVLRPGGEWVSVTAVSRSSRGATVYNFEVADNHDYYVGSPGMLVHDNSLVESLRGGKDVVVGSVKEARSLLKNFPELRAPSRGVLCTGRTRAERYIQGRPDVPTHRQGRGDGRRRKHHP